MAEGVITGAVVGAVVADLYKVVKDAVVKMVWCKKYCKALARDLELLLSVLREICATLELPAPEWEQRALLDFKSELEQGRLLIDSCSKLNGWHPIQRLRYGRKLVKLRQNILTRLQSMAAFNTLLLQQAIKRQEDQHKQESKVQELITSLIKATEAGNKARLMDWVRCQANSDPSTPENQADHADTAHLDELYTDRSLLGMDDSINQVKTLLFDATENIVTIVGGMGGIGKTTLAIAVCKDLQVQEFFENRVHFFTVSRSPDMRGLLSTIWQKVVGGPVPVFQSEEDASRQLKGRLLGMPYKQLLVLDDVWSKAHLEHLSFDCRTLITTRQASSLETRNSTIFNLRLLNKEDAQSLFCSWAFGQVSIPEWADEGLVKEVISECKCLPLALKVIGGSLSSAVRVRLAWLNARDKLRAAESLGEYHRDALQKRLQASVDALDPRLQECFLDLGAFPEDRREPVNTLLDIWVYVRGMDWTEAFLALVELSSRCLLDLHNKEGSRDYERRTLEYGTPFSLRFSQHDVMRDLALYLGTQGHATSQRARLMMPQKESNIPKSWLPADDQPLAAQIISIRTGAMREQDWPPKLAFPSAEALLLHFEGGHLPPFVGSMCKLKVISIHTGSGRRCMTASFEGLGQLQSIYLRNGSLTMFPVTLPRLERLRFLHMDSSELPDSLGNSSNLRSLDLVACASFTCWPKTFSRLEALKVLNLAQCSALQELPEDFGLLPALESLKIMSCILLKHLPRNFGMLCNLKHLVLSGCSGLQALPESFGELRCLEYLSLKYCSGVKHLPESFGKLQRLQELNLKGAKELEALPDSFGELCSLEILHMGGCEGLKQLPPTFGNLRKLRRWEMVGVGLESLPTSIGVGRGLPGLESMECSESLKPLWIEARGGL